MHDLCAGTDAKHDVPESQKYTKVEQPQKRDEPLVSAEVSQLEVRLSGMQARRGSVGD